MNNSYDNPTSDSLVSESNTNIGSNNTNIDIDDNALTEKDGGEYEEIIELSDVSTSTVDTTDNLSQNDDVSKDTEESTEKKEPYVTKNQWWLTYASVIGNMHVSKQIPCQDSHAVKKINDESGVAVVCDGAGSKQNSHLGSKFVSEEASDWLKQQFIDNPSRFEEHNLQELSNELYENLYHKLTAYAKEQDVEFGSLGCTLIAVIYQPHQLACIHIGDGRAAYQDIDRQWHSLIEPWNTEEGYTVFVTTDAVQQAPAPRSEYIRCHVIESSVAAFVLMSDGCENASFECLVFDKEQQKYIKPNKPFAKFFDPVKSTLIKVHNHYHDNQEEKNGVWEEFLKQGTPQLANEPDDKTMIFAINSIQLKSDEN